MEMKMEDRLSAYRKQTGKILTPKQLRRIIKKDVCPKCPARGTMPCETDSGNVAKQSHVGRYK